MASWRPPGSILEASGLPFGGSGPDFRRLWTSYLEPRTPRTPKNLQKQKLHHKVARPPKGGWAAVIPPGGFKLFNYNPPLPPKAVPRSFSAFRLVLLSVTAAHFSPKSRCSSLLSSPLSAERETEREKNDEDDNNRNRSVPSR